MQVIEEYQVQYPELKVVKFEQNRGPGFALNDGLKACSYNVVARMDTDDIAKPERFEKQLKVLEEHPEIDLVTAWIEEFGGFSKKNYGHCGRCPRHQKNCLTMENPESGELSRNDVS